MTIVREMSPIYSLTVKIRSSYLLRMKRDLLGRVLLILMSLRLRYLLTVTRPRRNISRYLLSVIDTITNRHLLRIDSNNIMILYESLRLSLRYPYNRTVKVYLCLLYCRLVLLILLTRIDVRQNRTKRSIVIQQVLLVRLLMHIWTLSKILKALRALLNMMRRRTSTVALFL